MYVNLSLYKSKIGRSNAILKKEYEENQGDVQEGKETYQDSDVEGYAYCATDKQRCMQDCSGSSLLSTLN